MCSSREQLADKQPFNLQRIIIMADSKTCKQKTGQLLFLAQLVNENKDIIKGQFRSWDNLQNQKRGMGKHMRANKCS